LRAIGLWRIFWWLGSWIVCAHSIRVVGPAVPVLKGVLVDIKLNPMNVVKIAAICLVTTMVAPKLYGR
jgi:hypothetical protein